MAYTFFSFSLFRSQDDERQLGSVIQRCLIFFIQTLGFLSLYAATGEIKHFYFYAIEEALYVFLMVSYRLFYNSSPRLIVNHMVMLLSIGFLMLQRLDFDLAVKQLVMSILAAIITMIVPFLMKKFPVWDKLTYFYAVLGILLLLVVAVAGSTSYGARLSISIGGVTFQFSEFVKIIFVFFVASSFKGEMYFKKVLRTSILAAVFVLILVASKDLGCALIFFTVYIVMLYVASKNILYMFLGVLLGSASSVGAYFLFSHVRTRVTAWADPFSVIDSAGDQVAQSLFAIGSGGWFGSGLYQGAPGYVPVVEEDFIFSAIAEELGGFFAICLILVCVSCFFMFVNVAMQMHVKFYRLIALGLGTVYIVQIFLMIGGVTKFIPSTGVTLPFVSYGGSSLFCSFILFNLILGLYIFKEKEDEYIGKKRKKRRKKKKETIFDEEIEYLG